MRSAVGTDLNETPEHPVAYLGNTDLHIPFGAYNGILTREEMVKAIRTRVSQELRIEQGNVSKEGLSLEGKVKAAQRVITLAGALQALDRAIQREQEIAAKVEAHNSERPHDALLAGASV